MLQEHRFVLNLKVVLEILKHPLTYVLRFVIRRALSFQALNITILFASSLFIFLQPLQDYIFVFVIRVFRSGLLRHEVYFQVYTVIINLISKVKYVDDIVIIIMKNSSTQQKDVALLVKKQSESGIFQNQRPLLIKSGFISYFSKVPKGFTGGDFNSLQIAQSLPKMTLSVANIQNIQRKANEIHMKFNKKNLINIQKFKDLINQQIEQSDAYSAKQGFQQWTFKCDNSGAAQTFVQQILIYKNDPNFKPNLKNLIGSYQEAKNLKHGNRTGSVLVGNFSKFNPPPVRLSSPTRLDSRRNDLNQKPIKKQKKQQEQKINKNTKPIKQEPEEQQNEQKKSKINDKNLNIPIPPGFYMPKQSYKQQALRKKLLKSQTNRQLKEHVTNPKPPQDKKSFQKVIQQINKNEHKQQSGQNETRIVEKSVKKQTKLAKLIRQKKATQIQKQKTLENMENTSQVLEQKLRKMKEQYIKRIQQQNQQQRIRKQQKQLQEKIQKELQQKQREEREEKQRIQKLQKQKQAKNNGNFKVLKKVSMAQMLKRKRLQSIAYQNQRIQNNRKDSRKEQEKEEQNINKTQQLPKIVQQTQIKEKKQIFQDIKVQQKEQNKPQTQSLQSKQKNSLNINEEKQQQRQIKQQNKEQVILQQKQLEKVSEIQKTDEKNEQIKQHKEVKQQNLKQDTKIVDQVKKLQEQEQQKKIEAIEKVNIQIKQQIQKKDDNSIKEEAKINQIKDKREYDIPIKNQLEFIDNINQEQKANQVVQQKLIQQEKFQIASISITNQQKKEESLSIKQQKQQKYIQEVQQIIDQLLELTFKSKLIQKQKQLQIKSIQSVQIRIQNNQDQIRHQKINQKQEGLQIIKQIIKNQYFRQERLSLERSDSISNNKQKFYEELIFLRKLSGEKQQLIDTPFLLSDPSQPLNFTQKTKQQSQIIKIQKQKEPEVNQVKKQEQITKETIKDNIKARQNKLKQELDIIKSEIKKIQQQNNQDSKIQETKSQPSHKISQNSKIQQIKVQPPQNISQQTQIQEIKSQSPQKVSQDDKIQQTKAQPPQKVSQYTQKQEIKSQLPQKVSQDSKIQQIQVQLPQKISQQTQIQEIKPQVSQKINQDITQEIKMQQVKIEQIIVEQNMIKIQQDKIVQTNQLNIKENRIEQIKGKDKVNEFKIEQKKVDQTLEINLGKGKQQNQIIKEQVKVEKKTQEANIEQVKVDNNFKEEIQIEQVKQKEDNQHKIKFVQESIKIQVNSLNIIEEKKQQLEKKEQIKNVKEKQDLSQQNKKESTQIQQQQNKNQVKEQQSGQNIKESQQIQEQKNKNQVKEQNKEKTITKQQQNSNQEKIKQSRTQKQILQAQKRIYHQNKQQIKKGEEKLPQTQEIKIQKVQQQQIKPGKQVIQTQNSQKQKNLDTPNQMKEIPSQKLLDLDSVSFGNMSITQSQAATTPRFWDISEQKLDKSQGYKTDSNINIYFQDQIQTQIYRNKKVWGDFSVQTWINNYISKTLYKKKYTNTNPINNDLRKLIEVHSRMMKCDNIPLPAILQLLGIYKKNRIKQLAVNIMISEINQEYSQQLDVDICENIMFGTRIKVKGWCLFVFQSAQHYLRVCQFYTHAQSMINSLQLKNNIRMAKAFSLCYKGIYGIFIQNLQKYYKTLPSIVTKFLKKIMSPQLYEQINSQVRVQQDQQSNKLIISVNPDYLENWQDLKSGNLKNKIIGNFYNDLNISINSSVSTTANTTINNSINHSNINKSEKTINKQNPIKRVEYNFFIDQSLKSMNIESIPILLQQLWQNFLSTKQQQDYIKLSQLIDINNQIIRHFSINLQNLSNYHSRKQHDTQNLKIMYDCQIFQLTQGNPNIYEGFIDKMMNNFYSNLADGQADKAANSVFCNGLRLLAEADIVRAQPPKISQYLNAFITAAQLYLHQDRIRQAQQICSYALQIVLGQQSTMSLIQLKRPFVNLTDNTDKQINLIRQQWHKNISLCEYTYAALLILFDCKMQYLQNKRIQNIKKDLKKQKEKHQKEKEKEKEKEKQKQKQKLKQEQKQKQSDQKQKYKLKQQERQKQRQNRQQIYKKYNNRIITQIYQRILKLISQINKIITNPNKNQIKIFYEMILHEVYVNYIVIYTQQEVPARESAYACLRQLLLLEKKQKQIHQNEQKTGTSLLLTDVDKISIIVVLNYVDCLIKSQMFSNALNIIKEHLQRYNSRPNKIANQYITELLCRYDICMVKTSSNQLILSICFNFITYLQYYLTKYIQSKRVKIQGDNEQIQKRYKYNPIQKCKTIQTHFSLINYISTLFCQYFAYNDQQLCYLLISTLRKYVGNKETIQIMKEGMIRLQSGVRKRIQNKMNN